VLRSPTISFLSDEQAEAIRRVIRDCGLHAEQMAATQFQVMEKGPGDYVTDIDRALDQKLAIAFAELFPADGVITEENIQSRQAFWEQYPRLWCIDPLDGTEEFIQGKSEYALMIGLLQQSQPIAGWVYASAAKHLYYGGPEWGLFQETAEGVVEHLNPVETPAPRPGFCPMIIGTKDQNNFGDAIAKVIPHAQFYSLGSFGLKVMDVILGRAGLYAYFNGRVKLWDTTGPLALAKAAGLVCCDLTGRPIQFSPEAIHPETLAHKQTILVGWPQYIELLRPKLQEAIAIASSHSHSDSQQTEP